ncbi:RNA ligase family protein [Bacillus infantis]|uniref:RNA ligase family protein n=1 Tax=Bacillus infantis TaxID=324767 RepID=UPI00209FEDA8|nr:RNA ligase family protein [Bacillus infantis]MCP1159304.1 RNA ligase family protein [Bacillus infantis]
MTQKKYMDVVRHGKSGTHLTIEGNPQIVIQEKLDGANASFKFEDGQLKCFSRNTELDESNTLRGFTVWANEHFKDHEGLAENYIFFGEWLVRHKLSYGENENKFYLFDIYDTEKEEYLPFNKVVSAAEELGLNLVPVFYEGDFQSIEHIQSFVGKSHLGEIGEGVVVKNVTYKDKYGNQQFTKFVSDQFAEIAKTKKHNVKPTNDLLQDFVDLTVNKARVSKIIHKLVDEGLIKEDYAIEDMGVILKHTGTMIYDDVIKEELDTLLKVVKSKIGRKVPTIVKEVLVEEERM